MLVYGDHEERCDPRQRLGQLNRELTRVGGMAAGVERHSSLVAILVEAGQLVQGVADAAFAVDGFDRNSAANSFDRSLLRLASAVCRSWDSDFAEIGELWPLVPRGSLPRDVTLKSPEGFAFYALYPEAYIDGARRLKLLAPPRVIGIRSIGTTLGAIVAAALNAPPPITVRPFGDPAAREVAIGPEVERELLDGLAHYVIVDEGPGRSGSSFGCVADWLMGRGVPVERIAFLPSHAGAPGPDSSEAHRQLWSGVQREPADSAVFCAELIGSWCATLIGPLDEPPQDISGGEWRRLHYKDEEEWPAVVPAWERRKFLVRAGGQCFLVRFAGLGSLSEAKLRIARTLHSERLGPEPFGLVHGFLVERWRDDARPLRTGEQPVGEVGRYIGTRARMLPAESGTGASVEKLLTMCRRNISLALGPAAVRQSDRFELQMNRLGSRIVRVRTDNRMAPHEWLRAGTGGLLKADAVDHHHGHDLIGCQDVAWDVAGAISEFGLDEGASAALIGATEDALRSEIDRELLQFYRIAYAAFRLGQLTMGAELTGNCPNEARRLTDLRDCYAAELQLLLEDDGGRSGVNPWLVEHRNEPPGEQTRLPIG
jgi:hypothetical protein